MSHRPGDRSDPKRGDLAPWLTLYLPLAVTLLPHVVRAASEQHYRAWIIGELGLIENLTVVFLAVAIVAGLTAARRSSGRGPWLRRWLLLLVAGCVYFLGEEISWGQHYFGWETPASWHRFNDQGETNLHNVAGLFDQVPRNLSTATLVAGGIVAPLARRLGWLRIDASRPFVYWITPTLAGLPAAALSAFITLPRRIAGAFPGSLDAVVDTHAGENKECLLALFLWIYLGSITRRLGTESSASSTASSRFTSSAEMPRRQS